MKKIIIIVLILTLGIFSAPLENNVAAKPLNGTCIDSEFLHDYIWGARRLHFPGGDSNGLNFSNINWSSFHCDSDCKFEYNHANDEWHSVNISAGDWYYYEGGSTQIWAVATTGNELTGQYCNYGVTPTAASTNTPSPTLTPTGPTSTPTLSPTASLTYTPTASLTPTIAPSYFLGEELTCIVDNPSGSWGDWTCPEQYTYENYKVVALYTSLTNNSGRADIDLRNTIPNNANNNHAGTGNTPRCVQRFGYTDACSSVGYTASLTLPESQSWWSDGGGTVTIGGWYQHGTDPGVGTWTVKFRPVYYGAALTPTPMANAENVICDGDMEQYYESTCWEQLDYGTIQRVDNSYNGYLDYTWDRINTLLAPWPTNWGNWFSYGEARCGTGYHSVGQVALVGTSLFTSARGAASAIFQDFTWDGGMANWRISARGRFRRILPSPGPGKAVAYLLNITSGEKYDLIFEDSVGLDWETFSGSLDLPYGSYRIILDAWDKENFLSSTIDDGVVYYDDVFLSSGSISNIACSNSIQSETPTPNNTWTPYPSTTPEGTITATWEWGVSTGTPPWQQTETPTPTATPFMINVNDCGFENGRGPWQFIGNASIKYDGGPIGPSYGHISGWNDNITQPIPVRLSGGVYLTAYVRYAASIILINANTNVRYILYTNPFGGSEWQQIRSVVYVPEGLYQLVLLSDSGMAADFDGVVLSTGSYVDPANSYNGYCVRTPTPGSTAFVPSPTPTIGSSRTPLPTYTLIPSFTPYATWTANPAQATLTSMAQGTATAQQQTATAQGTPPPNMTATNQAGIQATVQNQLTAIAAQLTSTALGTPSGSGGTSVPGGGGGPQQPPGGAGALCIRPGGWDSLNVNYWIDYEVCEIKSFISWGDNNNAQITSAWASFQRVEPFGTIAEAQAASQALRIIMASYSWSTTGLAGMKSQPNPNVFQNTANNPLFGGTINLIGSGPSYATYCDSKIVDFVGPRLGAGMCFIFDVLYRNNLMPWIQFFVNITSLIAGLMYVYRNFIKPAS